MKESGIEWIGEIPDDWSTRKLNRACFFQEGPGLRTWQFVDFGIKVICVTNIHDNIIDFSEMCKYISLEEYMSSYTHFTVQKGDVLLSSSGASWGKVAIFDSDETVILNTSTIRLNATASDYLTSGYLRWLLSSDNTSKQLELLMTGSCQPNFGPSHLAKIHIPLPSIQIQSQIASFLDTKCSVIDSTIEKERELIDKLKEYRQAVITEAVTKGIRPGVPMKDSGVEWIGEIPEGWKIIRLKNLSPVLRGASPRPIDDPMYFDDDGEYAWVRITDVSASDKYLNTGSYQLSELGANKSVKLEPERLFVSICATVGKPCISKIKCCIHDGFVHFPDMDLRMNNYLYYVFSSGECYKGLGKMGTQLNLNTETVANIKIPFLSYESCEQIADYLDAKCSAIDATIQKRELAIEKLTAYKQSLIYECVTGKREVQG